MTDSIDIACDEDLTDLVNKGRLEVQTALLIQHSRDLTRLTEAIEAKNERTRVVIKAREPSS